MKKKARLQKGFRKIIDTVSDKVWGTYEEMATKQLTSVFECQHLS